MNYVCYLIILLHLRFIFDNLWVLISTDADYFKPTDQDDIIDEALNFFKANVMFRNFEVKGAADRLLIYLTLYISQAIPKLANLDKGGAEKAVYQLAIENFSLPGNSSLDNGR
jgi:hypothetical protein